MTISGIVTEFGIPTSGSHPIGIALAPDGSLRFTENTGNKIGKITTSGAVTEIPIPTPGSAPLGIGAGPDGNLWFTETRGNKIGRLTLAGPIPALSLSAHVLLTLTLAVLGLLLLRR